ncbi:transposase [Bradyrhizobium genosp. SA-3]|uniref:transposase n=1 Tax=Bradyrhizobium genosp. SA-3 TaxID=508868 RepID=UPI0013EEA11F|nr:transposase [Bradyrhizobium genosp. SA-3]
MLDQLVGLKDALWDRMLGLIIGRRTSGPGEITVMFEGELWIVASGAPWRDLSEMVRWLNNALRRFGRWREKGVVSILRSLFGRPFENLIID